MGESELVIPGYPAHKSFSGNGWCRFLWRIYCLTHRMERWAYWIWTDEHTKQFKEAKRHDDDK